MSRDLISSIVRGPVERRRPAIAGRDIVAVVVFLAAAPLLAVLAWAGDLTGWAVVLAGAVIAVELAATLCARDPYRALGHLTLATALALGMWVAATRPPVVAPLLPIDPTVVQR